eukprot:NODE_4171_length_490_cov_186.117914_g3570_i0.p3 GENE.NODE_4171_length_490_cov_186.117914_g3570_i0~~NODE_4171_length_490_cov_186.117914_g3570_i0.p3  ORF type:complete len:59 (+),score=20.24 NODE_4171_length_490_cov_186.117914_g3570_i0:76-252(+)
MQIQLTACVTDLCIASGVVCCYGIVVHVGVCGCGYIRVCVCLCVCVYACVCVFVCNFK